MVAERYELADGGWVDFWSAWIADHLDWMRALTAELPLARERYRIAGREVDSPRLVAWLGDAEAGYVYSGVKHHPHPWTPRLTQLRALVQDACGLTFNAALANYYRDGADGMGWHADAEPEIGPSPEDRWIASVSLGAPRRFVLRHRRRRDDVRAFTLGDGALLVMRGTTQSHYRHCLAKTRRPVGPRLNLTFRHLCTR
jgi:alkylated DNA repair dioxygenase AlkB